MTGTPVGRFIDRVGLDGATGIPEGKLKRKSNLSNPTWKR
jgi:hypothetical protein